MEALSQEAIQCASDIMLISKKSDVNIYDFFYGERREHFDYVSWMRAIAHGCPELAESVEQAIATWVPRRNHSSNLETSL